MDNNLSISAIIELIGISAYTLRYYEKNGLIHSITKGSNGHRQYSSTDLDWIHFLVRLRTTGMSIRQMQDIANLRREGPSTIKDRRTLLEAHQLQITQQIKKLKEHQKVIQEKIEIYRQLELEHHQKEEIE